MDYTSVATGDSHTNRYLVLMFGVVSLNIALVALVGYQEAKLSVLASGIVFLPMMYFSDRFSTGQIFQSPGTFTALCFSFTMPILIGELIGFNGGMFSFWSLPSESQFFASILADLTPYSQSAFNGFYAPVVETALAWAITIFAFKNVFKPFFTWVLMPFGVSPHVASIMAGFIAPLPFSWMFSKIHSGRSAAWQLLAIFVMYLMLAPVLISDLMKRPIPVFGWIFGFGIPFSAGAHVALNVGQMGGLYPFFFNPDYGILQATGPMLGINMIVAGFFFVNFLGTAVFIWSKTVGRFVGPSLSWRALVRMILPA